MVLDLNTPIESRFGEYVESPFGVLDIGAAPKEWIDIILAVLWPDRQIRLDETDPCSPWGYAGDTRWDVAVAYWDSIRGEPHRNGARWAAAYGNNRWWVVQDQPPGNTDPCPIGWGYHGFAWAWPPYDTMPDGVAGYAEIGTNWSFRHDDPGEWPGVPYASIADFRNLFQLAKGQIQQKYGVSLTPGRSAIRLWFLGNPWTAYDYQDYENYPNERPDHKLIDLFVAELQETYGQDRIQYLPVTASGGDQTWVNALSLTVDALPDPTYVVP